MNSALLAAAIAWLPFAAPAAAAPVDHRGELRAELRADLRDVRVVGSHFTTAILGMPRDIAVRNPATARFLVLRLAGRVAGGRATLFAPDFMLAYAHGDGAVDRANCVGIGDIAEDGTVGQFRNGPVSRLALPGPEVQFALAFLIEADVERVELYLLGDPTPVRHALGAARPYSVFLTTNREPGARAPAEAALRAGGYAVSLSAGLTGEASGVVVIHHPALEGVARDIAARLAARLGTEVRRQTYAGQGISLSEYDVLVWIGRERATTTAGRPLSAAAGASAAPAGTAPGDPRHRGA
jgi:hypothetical protein